MLNYLSMVSFILLHGLEGLEDGFLELLVKSCWLTAILITVLLIKLTINSARKVTEKSMLILVTMLSFVLISVIFLLLLPRGLTATTTIFDVRPLFGIGSLMVWLTVTLDILAMIQAKKSQSEIGIGKTFMLLFLPIIGAGYVLISKRVREGKFFYS